MPTIEPRSVCADAGEKPSSRNTSAVITPPEHGYRGHRRSDALIPFAFYGLRCLVDQIETALTHRDGDRDRQRVDHAQLRARGQHLPPSGDSEAAVSNATSAIRVSGTGCSW